MRLASILICFLLLVSCTRKKSEDFFLYNTFVDSRYNFVKIDSSKIILGNDFYETSLSGAFKGTEFTSDYIYHLCNNRERACRVKLKFEIGTSSDIYLSTLDTLINSFYGQKGLIHFVLPEKTRFFESWDSMRIQKMGGLEFDIPKEDMYIFPDGTLKIRSGILPNRKGEHLKANIDKEQMKLIDHFIRCIHPQKFAIFHGEVADAETKITISLTAGGEVYLFTGYFFPPYFRPLWTFIVSDYKNLEFE